MTIMPLDLNVLCSTSRQKNSDNNRGIQLSIQYNSGNIQQVPSEPWSSCSLENRNSTAENPRSEAAVWIYKGINLSTVTGKNSTVILKYCFWSVEGYKTTTLEEYSKQSSREISYSLLFGLSESERCRLA